MTPTMKVENRLNKGHPESLEVSFEFGFEVSFDVINALSLQTIKALKCHLTKGSLFSKKHKKVAGLSCFCATAMLVF